LNQILLPAGAGARRIDGFSSPSDHRAGEGGTGRGRAGAMAVQRSSKSGALVARSLTSARAASPLERGDAEGSCEGDFVREFIDLLMEYAPGQVPRIARVAVRARKKGSGPQPSTLTLSLR